MNYSAKILLFGEHTILRGSRALATTYPQLGGHWAWDPSANQYHLLDYASYLMANCTAEVDAAAFQADLHSGLYFDSNIPMGYGLGSSGALCAALFDRYALPESKQLHLSALKKLFARLEQFFHGSSSGTDPLIIHLRQAVCLFPNGEVEPVDVPALAAPYQFFLLDTHQSRQTAPLVNFFTHQYDTQTAFRQLVEQEWIPATEQAITACLYGDTPDLWQAFSAISAFQLSHLPPMVLSDLHRIWRTGLEGESFRLKICGAGGGGFCLGITKDWPSTKAVLEHWPVTLIGG